MAQDTATPKSWSYCTGEHGVNRVRVYEKLDRGGVIYAEFRERDRRKVRVCLGHKDRERAKAKAEELALALRQRGPAITKDPLTLRKLFDIYVQNVTPSKRPSTQSHDRTAAELFCRAWGPHRNPKTIGLIEWRRFIEDRRAARLTPTGPKGRARPTRVGDRQIEYDLKFLMAVLKWATLARAGEESPLLARNPCDGFPIPSELSPKRPRLDESRYRAMLAKAPTVHLDFHLALVLVHETGHRLSSVRHLWVSDVSLAQRRVRWRGEVDKEGNTHVTPLSDEAIGVLEPALARRQAVGDVWLFPVERRHGNGEVPRSRSTFSKWWWEAEALAGLDHDKRWGWHSLRRKFATELKHIPLKDLCDLGGWRSAETVLTCYTESDEHTMRTALAQRRAMLANGTPISKWTPETDTTACA